VHQFAKFLVLLSSRAAPNGEDGLYVGIEQAFTQDALADHSGCAEEDDVHVFITS
jgi:hypothetical protein